MRILILHHEFYFNFTSWILVLSTNMHFRLVLVVKWYINTLTCLFIFAISSISKWYHFAQEQTQNTIKLMTLFYITIPKLNHSKLNSLPKSTCIYILCFINPENCIKKFWCQDHFFFFPFLFYMLEYYWIILEFMLKGLFEICLFCWK